MKNQVLGYEVPKNAKPEIGGNIFQGTDSITPAHRPRNASQQIKIFSGSLASLASYYSEEHQTCIYVWGTPSHPTIPKANIPKWCITIFKEKAFRRFRELIGTFVVVIDDPKEQRIVFVSDILGLRPFFFGQYEDRLVFGSDVWSMFEAGLSEGKIDYDALSAWVTYKFNCTSGSLFTDLHRLPPGTIVSFQNKTATDIPYAEFGEEQLATSTKDVSQDIHDIVSTTLKILLSDHPQTWLSLSGGFDSRYLLALSTIHSKTPPLCATVDCSEDRVSTASLIADTLNVPLRVFTAPKSTWDLFKEVFHYTADGFPISKHVLYRLAMESSGVPIVNGYLGDFLIRGARDTCLGRYEQDCNNNLSEVLQKHHKGANFRIFRSSIAKRILDRSRVPMDLAVEKWSKSGQSFIRADLYYRQRFYISNNFLQHLPLTEALLPFYSWELIDYKLCRDFSLFNNELYAHIFWNFFPRIANIPKSKNEAHSSISEHTKKWSREFIPLISGRHRPSVVSGFRKLPWVIAGIVGASKVESTILLLKRLSMLEDRILSSGIDFDWYRI